MLLLLGCLVLVLGVVAPEALASPISNAVPHHRHVRPWAAWHRTTHVRRNSFVPITTGAELPDLPTSTGACWAMDDDLHSANDSNSPLRLDGKAFRN